MKCALIFCQNCGSQKIGLTDWLNKNIARIICNDCGHEGLITGFSIGESSSATNDIIGEAYGNMEQPE